MKKAKFSDNLLSKTEDAHVNEVLGKVIAHNLCMVIQSFYELGIEPSFLPVHKTEPFDPGSSDGLLDGPEEDRGVEEVVRVGTP